MNTFLLGMKKLRLILTFYQSFAFLSNLLSAVCLYLIYSNGKDGIYLLQFLFWFKLLTLLIIYYGVNAYKKNEFYYYQNLGLSKKQLWIPVLVIDFLLFCIASTYLAAYLHETLTWSR